MAIKEKKPWRQTPLIESTALSNAAGWSLNRRSRIFLKLENLQPGGSFKSRGIGNLCLSALRRSPCPDAVHYFCSSGGNAGLACVHAANFLGRPATVVVPTSTAPMMVRKIVDLGAHEVVQFGASVMDADAYLRDVVIPEARAQGAECVYVPPFDHPDIWAGHSSLVDELRVQFGEMNEAAPDVIGCSVGGGGMFCGIAEGLERAEALGAGEEWENVRVLGVETKGAESLASALEAGRLLTLPRITSKATTLGCARVAERTWELANRWGATGRFRNAVFADADAALGCVRLADAERTLVELACGVTVSLCYDGRLATALGRPPHPEEKIVLVICGGQGVNTNMIEEWRTQYAIEPLSSRVNRPVGGLAKGLANGLVNGHTNGLVNVHSNALASGTNGVVAVSA